MFSCHIERTMDDQMRSIHHIENNLIKTKLSQSPITSLIMLKCLTQNQSDRFRSTVAWDEVVTIGPEYRPPLVHIAEAEGQ